MARNRKRQSRKSEHLRLATNAGDVLPSLSSLEHIPAYDQLRASLRQKEQYQEIVCALSHEGIPASELHLGCVVSRERQRFVSRRVCGAIHQGEFLRSAIHEHCNRRLGMRSYDGRTCTGADRGAGSA